MFLLIAQFLVLLIAPQHLVSLQQQAPKAEVGDPVLARIQRDFVDVSVTRSQLQARLEEFVVQFPENVNLSIAIHYLEVLRTMAQEEEARNLHPPLPWAEMSDPEKVAELIYQLRDLNAGAYFNKFPCNVLFSFFQRDSPAKKLEAMGYAAVPQLIEALADKRLTRSTNWIDAKPYDSAVLPVGEAVHQILEAIAMTGFQPSYRGYRQNLDVVAQAWRTDVLAWWSELQLKGERQLWIDSLRSGRGSVERARSIVKKYPSDAAAAIGEAIERLGPDEWFAPRYIVVLAECPTAQAKALARNLMESAPALGQRVAAASVVAQTDLPAALAAMQKEWVSLSLTGHPFGPELLVSFLATSGDPAAIKTLARGLRLRPMWLRSEVMLQIGATHKWGVHGLAPFATPGSGVAAQYQTECGNLLASQLTDLKRNMGYQGFFGDITLRDPRMADLAALRLSVLRPDLFKFEPEQTPAQLEAQRLRFIEIWKREVGRATWPGQ